MSQALLEVQKPSCGLWRVYGPYHLLLTQKHQHFLVYCFLKNMSLPFIGGFAFNAGINADSKFLEETASSCTYGYWLLLDPPRAKSLSGHLYLPCFQPLWLPLQCASSCVEVLTNCFIIS